MATWKLFLFFSLVLGVQSVADPIASFAEDAKTKQIQAEETEDSLSERTQFRPIVGTKGMVVSSHRIASEWGAEILRRGGNAIDAAVATGFMLSVTNPQNGGLGGGGFLVFCPGPKYKKRKDCEVLDYRESSPLSATAKEFSDGGKDTKVGPSAAGVPGVPAGLLSALRRLGTKSRSDVLSRPIELAVNGFPVDGSFESGAKKRWEKFNDEAKRVFGCGSLKEPCHPGQLLKQQDLANTLRQIQSFGTTGFYRKSVGQKLVDETKKAGGLLTHEDLHRYEPVYREPVRTKFHGYEVVSMPPPSAGGTNVIQMLGYAELAREKGLLKDGYGSVSSIHALAHGMSLAFADRAEFFGDPQFSEVPVTPLTSLDYLKRQWKKTFQVSKMSVPSESGKIDFNRESDETTHFSVVDKDGNAVSITTTLNFSFGSGFLVKGTGVVLNNEMDDFSVAQGQANGFGLVSQSSANDLEGGKRPLSSMAPTIVLDQEKLPRLVLGGAGGPRITTAVFLAVVNRYLFEMPLPDAIMSSRFHHQWKPNILFVEPYGVSKESKDLLKEMGYEVEEKSYLARLRAIEQFKDGRLWGVADPRAEGFVAIE